MERKKRPFYIIGNNPNTVEEAREFLQIGANALEPDIVYADGQFYVSHSTHLSYENVPKLEEYLQKLKALLLTEPYNIALIIWDIKTTNFDPNHFIRIVKENLSGELFDGITMLITNADDHEFLNQFKGGYNNIGVGLDESNITPSEIERIFKTGNQKNFTYADGITTLLNKTGVYRNINEAQFCCIENQPGSFGIIYTWVLSRESSMRTYLNTYIDGIMVDVGSVKLLGKLLAEQPYSEVYEIAQNGYNPFSAAPIPKYKLSVKTKDTFMAGTDIPILFTLTGVGGQSLKSLPFDGNETGGLERGSTSYLLMEGLDLGEIKSLKVEALTDGIGADWLPEKVTVESKWLKKEVTFVFNGSDDEEWLTKKEGGITKFTTP